MHDLLPRRRCLFLPAVIALGLWCGCSKSNIGTTHPTKGKVVYKGGQAVRGGTVELVSTADESLRAVGDIEEDGTFILTAWKDREERPGAVEGEYEVFVEVQSDRDDLPGGEQGGDGRIALGKRKITAGQNDLLLEIKAQRRR